MAGGKKSLVWLRIFILWLIMAASGVFATDYYVATTGLDTNAGTLAQPFLTIQRAANVMTAGDTCYIRAGVYRETVTPAYSGTSNSHITFMPYNNEDVTITGCDLITGWQTYSGYIKRAAITSGVSQVFVAGQRINEARYPNQPLDKPMISTDYWAAVDSDYSTMTVEVDGASRSTDYWVGGRVVVLCGAKNITLYGSIDSSSGNTVHVTNASYDNNWANCPVYTGEGYGYIIGVLGELDVAGEWYADANYLYVWAPNNADPASVTVEARMRHAGMDLTDRSYIDVTGINFKASTIIMREATGCTVDGCTVRYPRAFFSWNKSFCRNDVINPGDWEGTGVEISGSDNIVQNTYIAHSWGDGISMWNSDNTIDNCLVEDTDWSGIDCAAVSVSGSNQTISNNTLRISARAILTHFALGDSLIAGNNMHDGGIITVDTGITYTYMDFTPVSEISYNWIHGLHAPSSNYGIYLDGNSTNYLVHHNVILNCNNAIHMNAAPVTSDIYIFNNTMWNIRDKGMHIGYSYAGYIDDIIVWNNLSDHNDFTGTDLQNNLYTPKDGFTDSSSGDFSLLSTSEAINAGCVISGITDGYYSTAPDIGAYEYGVTAWTAGADFEAPDFDDTLSPPPANVTGQWVSASSVQLDWDDVSDLADEFTVEYRMDSTSTYSSAGTVNAPTETITVSSLDPTRNYYFRVRAIDNSVYGIFCRPFLVKKLNSRTGYWRFDSGIEGSTAYDETTNCNNGTLTNMNLAGCYVDGIIAKALRFDGSNDYVNLPASSNMLSDSPFTISAWIKTDVQQGADGGEGRIVTLHRTDGGAAGTGASIYAGGYGSFSRNSIIFQYCTTDSGSDSYLGYETPSPYYYDGNWHLITATHDGTTAKLYYDGVKVAEESNTFGKFGTTNAKIGSYNGAARFFSGDIDEVRSYNYVLDADSVTGLFEGHKLIANWELDDGSGSSAADSSGYENDGTLTYMDTASCWVSGISNSALNFDGDNDYVSCGNPADAAVSGNNLYDFTTTNEFTISCWVKPGDLLSYQGIVSKWTGSWAATPYHIIMLNSGNVRIGIGDGSTSDYIQISADNFALAEWTHLAFTYDGSMLRGYVNGEEKTSKKSDLILTANSGALKIGCYSGASYSYNYNGAIDKVRLYNYALSANELLELADKDSNLLGHWKFDDGSGSGTADASEYENDGTLTNMNTANCWTTGISGNALDFDGTDDYVDCGTDSIYNFSDTNQFTICCWIKPDDLSSYQGIIGKWGGWLATPYQILVMTSGRIRIGVGNGTTSDVIELLDDNFSVGKWSHIAFTYDGSTVRGYANGELKASKKLDYTLASNPYSVKISGYAGVNYFDGCIDEVRMYNQALDADKIKAVYNENVVVGDWAFDDGIYKNIATDSSESGNNGTLTDMSPENCWVNGIAGNALDFDGSDDYVDCGTDSIYNFSEKNQFTISCWIKPDDLSSYQGIIGKWGGGWATTPYQILVMTSGRVRIGIGNGTTSDVIELLDDNFSIGKWSHIAFTYDGSVLRGYANGVEETSKQLDYNLASTTPSLKIGLYGSGAYQNYFDGCIDQVRLHDLALDASQIKALYKTDMTLGHWSFDDTGGNSAADSSRYGKNGTLTNMDLSSCRVDGIADTALNFDGTDDYVDCSAANIYNFSETNSFTICCWIKPDDLSSYQGIIGKWSSSWYTTPYQVLVMASGNIRIGIGDGTVSDVIEIPAANFTVGQWTHIAFTYDGSTLRGYADGEEKVSKSVSMTLATNASNLIIGKYSSNYFDGCIDDVQLYNLPLSADEIMEIYEEFAP